MQEHNYFYNTALIIDDVINNFSNESFNTIKELLEDDKFLNYFYYELNKKEYKKNYFEILFNNDFFNPDINPKPIPSKRNKEAYGIPYWSALNLLEKVIEQNSKEKDILLTKKLDSLINRFIEYGEVENHYTNTFILKAVSSLPIELIKDEHFIFFRETIDSRFGADLFGSDIGKNLINKAIKEKNSILLNKTLELILEYNVTGNDYKTFKAKIADYWLEDIFEKYSKDIIKLLKVEAISIVVEKIKEIISKDKYSFSLMEINSISDGRNSGIDDYKRILVNIIRDGLLFLSNIELIKVVNEFYLEEHNIFKRLALFIINKKFVSLENIFWDNFPETLEEQEIKPELFDLIKDNSKVFSEEQINKIIILIEKIDFNKIDDEEKRKRHNAYRRKEWLEAISKSEKKIAKELFTKYNEIIPDEISHPGRPISSWTKFGYDTPEDIEMLKDMSFEKQIKYLNNVAENMIEGSRRYYKDIMMDKINDLIDNIQLFRGSKRYLQHSVLWTCYDVWRNGVDFKWGNIFKFMNYLFFEDKEFWKEKYNKNDDNYRNYIVSISSELIYEGVRNDNHAFSEEYLQTAKEILLKLYANYNDSENAISRIESSILNTIYGKLYSALINLNLRIARINRLPENERWDSEIKAIFDKELERNSNSSKNFSGILGQYLVNLYWIDKNWLINNINKIFLKSNEEHWKLTMQSYLFFKNQIYKDIYKIFIENDLFETALKLIEDESSKKRVAELIVAGYLFSFENETEIKKLLEEQFKKNDDISTEAIINYCERVKIEKEISEKVKFLWAEIHKNAIEKSYQNNEMILSNLCRLTKSFPDITEINDLLEDSVKLADWNHNVPGLIKIFTKQIEDHPEVVGKLLITLIDSEYNRFYFVKPEEFENLISILYKKCEKGNADYICNKLGEKGLYFLKELWMENNNKT